MNLLAWWCGSVPDKSEDLTCWIPISTVGSSFLIPFLLSCTVTGISGNSFTLILCLTHETQ